MTARISGMRTDIGNHFTLVLAAGVACLIALLLLVSRGPEPHYPEWATVTKELEGSDWPLVTAARYDAANHFILVDLRPGVSLEAALRLACESVRARVELVDPTVGFALYEAPDRVVAHSGDCAAGAPRTPREIAQAVRP
jgi:hypothetical protein